MLKALKQKIEETQAQVQWINLHTFPIKRV